MEKYSKVHYLSEKNNIACLQEKDDILENIYYHFMNYGDEILYIEKNKEVVGIVTPGDLYRFYINQLTDVSQLYNRKFIRLSEFDFEQADYIFKKNHKLHEIPVVSSDNILLGCIRRNVRKPDSEWDIIRDSLLFERNAYSRKRKEWIRSQIKEVLGRTKAELFIIKSPEWEDLGEKADLVKYERENIGGMIESVKNLRFDEQREFFFGDGIYDKQYMDVFWKEVEKLDTICVNGVMKYVNQKGTIFNIQDGHRIVEKHIKSNRKLYIIGPCTMFGTFVNDEQTIGNYLQKKMQEKKYNYEVVISCMGGGEDEWFSHLVTEPIRDRDIVVYMATEFWNTWNEIGKAYNNVHCISFMHEIYSGIDTPEKHFTNHPAHINYFLTKKISEKIWDVIQDKLKWNERDTEENNDFRNQKNFFVGWDIWKYYIKKRIMETEIISSSDDTGAIVMTANPFTRGHRYLIEQASSMVKQLIVFVVEEDRFDFSFDLRYRMVKEGCYDLENVRVVPSGKYIISKETFSQYFKKDKIDEVEDAEYDLHIFGSVISEIYGIKQRFVGTEPFDRVTSNYNKCMKEILDKYHIGVREIFRIADESGEAISASRVRRLLNEKRSDDFLLDLLPQTTIDILGHMDI